MWWKIALGAAAGLVVGHFVVPGYWLWVVAGIVLGYAAEAYGRRKNRQPASSNS